MRSFSTNTIKIMLLALMLTLFSSAYVLAEEVNTKILYTLTSSHGSYEQGELTLYNIATVLHFSELKDNPSGFTDLTQFMKTLNAYMVAQKEKKQTAALSLYNDTGATNVIIQFTDPIENNGALSMRAQVLQGTLPANIGMSTLFIVLLEPHANEKE